MLTFSLNFPQIEVEQGKISATELHDISNKPFVNLLVEKRN